MKTRLLLSVTFTNTDGTEKTLTAIGEHFSMPGLPNKGHTLPIPGTGWDMIKFIVSEVGHLPQRPVNEPYLDNPKHPENFRVFIPVIVAEMTCPADQREMVVAAVQEGYGFTLTEKQKPLNFVDL